MKSRLFVTTSIPYVNAEPHIGFALELVQADVLARHARLTGRTVRFQTGTDENALKNALAAEQHGLAPHAFVDRNAARFRALTHALDISADDFIRTTEPRHRAGVHALWQALRPGDLTLRNYTGYYCTGCEDFYLPRDLVDGACPDHGTRPVEIAEQNYFFNLAAYQPWLEDQLRNNHPQILPSSRANEVLAFLRRGLTDFSVSRAAARTRGWGIPVPGDERQTIYVWIDALANYLSALGYGAGDAWHQWWNPDVEKIHVIGKNVWKFHALYWPALLKSAGLPRPDKILVHGFVTVEGRKVGKSLGNAVDPFALIDRFGPDPVRYYLLRAIPPFADGDFSLARLEDLYRSDLANGIGNLVSRLASLGATTGHTSFPPAQPPAPPEGFSSALAACQFDKALESLWTIVTTLNRRIEHERPWQLSGATGQAQTRTLLTTWLTDLWTFTHWLQPFLPHTAGAIRDRLYAGPIHRASPLFPRLSTQAL